jgi:hypothetical protein
LPELTSVTSGAFLPSAKTLGKNVRHKAPLYDYAKVWGKTRGFLTSFKTHEKKKKHDLYTAKIWGFGDVMD